MITSLKNKYFIAILAFGTWIFFFDRNDIPTQLSRRKELKELNGKIDYYNNQIQLDENELKNLQHDPLTLEKYAREKYFMKKDNEEIFIME